MSIFFFSFHEQHTFVRQNAFITHDFEVRVGIPKQTDTNIGIFYCFEYNGTIYLVKL